MKVRRGKGEELAGEEVRILVDREILVTLIVVR
jgi:hypothetical protein